MKKNTPMDAQAASRIQSSGARAGDAGKGSFAARAQSAAAKNASTGQGDTKGAASGGGAGGSSQSGKK